MKKRIVSLLIALCLLCGLVSLNASAAEGFSSARLIALNEKVVDNISDARDINYYRFTLTSAGTIDFTFTRPYQGEDKEYWVLGLFNEKTEEISAYSLNGVDTSTTTYTVGLDTGSYYLQIHGGSWSGYYSNRFSTGTYTVCVNYRATEYGERENNETVATATPMIVNQAYSGSINNARDVDYYRFTLTSAGLVNFTFNRPYQGEDKEYWVLGLFNEKTEEISAYSLNGVDTSTTTYTVGLDTGSYYLQIHGGSWSGYYSNTFSTGTYTVCINYRATEYGERENNETVVTATPMIVNQAYSGSINNARDVDYYRFSLPYSGKVNLTFSRPNLGENKECWVMTLLDEKTKELQKYSLNGVDTSTTGDGFTLAAGIYYLFIHGGSWSGYYSNRFSTDTYNFRVNYTSSQPIPLPTQFVDVPDGAYYVDAVKWAVGNGITSGIDSTHFAPTQTCTRAQAVTFLWNAAGKPDVGTTDKFIDVKPTA